MDTGPIPVARSTSNADGFIERLVMHVVDSTAANAAVRDRHGVSARDQAGDELPAVLATGRAGECAVLALQETTRVRHDRDQKTSLVAR